MKNVNGMTLSLSSGLGFIIMRHLESLDHTIDNSNHIQTMDSPDYTTASTRNPASSFSTGSRAESRDDSSSYAASQTTQGTGAAERVAKASDL